MTRRDFLQAAAAAPSALQQAAARPNVILIVADDLGYGDLGCYGQKQIETPHIDRMAAEGTRFTEAYAGSTVCAPSRCALFTGLHTGHARMRGNTSHWLRPQDFTLSEMLQKNGYRTGLFGKWSLGGIGTDGHPNKKGFDEFFGYFSQSQAHLYYPQMLLHNQQEVNLTGNWGTSRKQYAHDLITDRALEFIGKAPGPFFAHIAWTIPHANNELGRDTGNGMEVPSDEPYTKRDWPQVEKNFAAMVTRMDRDAGRLFDLLKKRGIDNNTLVLFTSDNGPHREGGHDPAFFRSSGPLRGIKRDLYEGGIRVPAIARWPGKVPAATSDFVWAFWDVLPTLAEVTGTSAPAGLDGQSVVPALFGREQKPHEDLYWEFHERKFAQAMRAGDWKAVRYGFKGAIELYDLKSDLAEATDIAAKNPDVIARMARLLDSARTDTPDYPVKEGA